MKKTNIFKMLMAMAVVLTLGVFASCGGDDPDPTPTPTPPAKATSCTLYYVEVFSNSDFNFASIKRAFNAAGDAENYTEITKDGCSGYAGLSSDLTNIIQTTVSSNYPKIAADCSVNVVPVTVNTFPKVFNVKYQFAVKPDYVSDTKQNFGIFTGFVTVSNTGATTTIKTNASYAEGIQAGKEASYLERIAPSYARAITVQNESGVISGDWSVLH